MEKSRRNFLRQSGILTGSSISGALASTPSWWNFENTPILKPKALKEGDRVGIITPSSNISRDNFEAVLRNMEMLGLKPVYSSNIRVKLGFLAGTDAQRIHDLHQMFEDDSIAGIICARGGYGASRLLGKIDYRLIRNHPKLFVGYSDITALHQAILEKAGLISFHGPNGDSGQTEFSLDHYKHLLFGKDEPYRISGNNLKLPSEIRKEVFTIKEGKSRGILSGGNLTLISTLMGTPYEINLKDRILFFEDIGEAPYRIDRMITQLLLSGKLKEAKGIVLGNFNDCEVDPDDPDYPDSLSLKEVLTERLMGLNIPVLAGMPFGHLKNNAILPLGVMAELDTAKQQITLLEKPTR